VYNKDVPNITLSIDEATLREARAFAKEQGWSLNDLVRRLLHERIAPNSEELLRATFDRADELKCRSEAPWSREDLYDRSVLR
jgi:hypothetical protein